MKIEFKITDAPVEGQEKHTIAYLEGALSISVFDVMFFSQLGVLLVELAVFIDKWLGSIGKGETVDFVYESMDNDEPIIVLKNVKDDYYEIQSIWQEVEISDFLSEREIVSRFEDYLSNLDEELKSRMGFDLRIALQGGQ